MLDHDIEFLCTSLCETEAGEDGLSLVYQSFIKKLASSCNGAAPDEA